MYVNPTAYLIPVIALVVGLLPVLYFRRKWVLLGVAALAYFFAIGAKVVVQTAFLHFFQTPSLPTYLAYGLLTFVFEVGLAYLFLRFVWSGEAAAPGLHAGWAYGAYLAFFENAVLLGVLPLLSLVAAASPSLQLTSNPYAANVLPLALPYLGERTASLLAHAVWGLVAYWALWQRKPWLLLSTLPLALLDTIAAWWDFTHAVSYPVLVGILLVYTLVTGLAALLACGLWPRALKGLRRAPAPLRAGEASSSVATSG